MTTRFFRNTAGEYLGGYGGGANPPLGAVEVPVPPRDARAVWVNGSWFEPAPPPRLVPLGVLAARIIASGKLADLAAVLDAQPEARESLMALTEGVYENDTQARAILTAAGLDPDAILAA
jgi:hypothetical protein